MSHFTLNRRKITKGLTQLKNAFFEQPPELLLQEKSSIKTAHEQFIIRASSLLSYINGIIAFFYLGTAIALFVWAFYADRSRFLDLTITNGFPFWSLLQKQFIPGLDVIQQYYVIYILLSIPTISGLISIFRLLNIQIDSFLKPVEDTNYYSRASKRLYMKNVKTGVFAVRTFEWLLCGTMGIWIIASIIGITEVMLLFLLVVLSVALFVMLHFHECFNYVISFLHKVKNRIKIKNPETYTRGYDTRGRAYTKKTEPEIQITPNPTVYIFRSYGCYISAIILHIWLWLIIGLYYGYGGSSDTQSWKAWRWALIPIEFVVFMVTGACIFCWTRNVEYEEYYIDKRRSKGIPLINYKIEYWNNNLRLEMSTLILTFIGIMVLVWTVWLGMLYG
jgi:hypothetical protein